MGQKERKARYAQEVGDLWLAPYRISSISNINSYHLETLSGESIPLPVKKQLLKEYVSKGT